jgi:hypothetical protein
MHRCCGRTCWRRQRGDVVNLKGFFVDALTSALELGIAAPDDLVRHITPDVLAAHLPRPLWARLLTACLGASRVDAQLVVETLGVPNLCEHVPAAIIWACIADIGARSLGDRDSARSRATAGTRSPSTTVTPVLAPPPPAEERPVAAAEPPAPLPLGPSIPSPAAAEPLADLISELESESSPEPRMAALRPRSPTAQRFRPGSTSVGRLTGRRPQASASERPRRVATEVEPEPDPEPGEVDDSQLVEWKGATQDDDFSDLERKR